MSKVLVSYFSASGTVDDVAKKLAQAAGADIHQPINCSLVRAHNPDSVSWDGSGYWWETDHFDEALILRMVNESIASLGGKGKDNAKDGWAMEHFGTIQMLRIIFMRLVWWGILHPGLYTMTVMGNRL